MHARGGASTTAPTSADLLLDLSGLDAARADVQALRRAVDHDADALDVRVPPALGAAVRVADVHAEAGVLPADLANRCHDQVPRVHRALAIGRSAGPGEGTGAPVGSPTSVRRAEDAGSQRDRRPAIVSPR